MIEPQDVRRFSRELSALIRKANDADGFAVVVGLLAEADDQLRAQARELNSQGFSAAELAAPLGVTRQAVRKRWLA